MRPKWEVATNTTGAQYELDAFPRGLKPEVTGGGIGADESAPLQSPIQAAHAEQCPRK
jgi:hypothetical protein